MKEKIFITLIFSCLVMCAWGQDSELIRKAESGDIDAQAELANNYYYGISGFEKDYTKAFKWALSAAEKGNAEAQYLVGRMYKYGDGVTKDEEKAEYWLLKSARQGYETSMYSLGLFYKTKNKDEAIYWFKKKMDTHYAERNKECSLSSDELRKLGVYYHPDDKSSGNYSSNNSSSRNSNRSSSSSSSSSNRSSSNSSTSVPQRDLQPVQVWNPCLTCGGTGLCVYCQGRGKKWYGNYYENCVTCYGNMYCQSCYGRKGYHTTEYR